MPSISSALAELWHSLLCSISPSALREGMRGAGIGVGLGRLTHVMLTLTAVWRMKWRLPYKIDCHIIIGSTCWAGGGDVSADGGKGEASFQRCPLMGFSLCESVCDESATYERESFYNHWPLWWLEMPAWDWLWEWLTSTLIVLLWCRTKRCQWVTASVTSKCGSNYVFVAY